MACSHAQTSNHTRSLQIAPLIVALRIHKRNREGIIARSAAHAAAVDFLSAVGHAVAASAGGVAAPAHAARICSAADGDDGGWITQGLAVAVELQTVLGAVG